MDVTGHARNGRLALGWVAGAEPIAGGESGVSRTAPSRTLLLVFAAAVRACWPDRSESLYPGTAAKETEVLAAVAALGPLTASAADGGVPGERHHKGALRRLYDCGLLEPTGPDCRHVRLGPMVALWSETETNALRAVYDQLPLPPPEEASGTS
ncbi:hypothetical protein ACN265_18970 [Micromonospora sp. WMMD730]|uniref:hypothetical protein n=1 Tax=Micromonospora sp. WMMD730 TaxID=3404128 RepID=UPI003B923A9E